MCGARPLRVYVSRLVLLNGRRRYEAESDIQCFEQEQIDQRDQSRDDTAQGLMYPADTRLQLAPNPDAS